jgi:hypothetical protein
MRIAQTGKHRIDLLPFDIIIFRGFRVLWAFAFSGRLGLMWPSRPVKRSCARHTRISLRTNRHLTGRLISPPAPATAGKRADTHAETSAEASAQRHAGHRRPGPSPLTDADRKAIHAAVDALPPMTDEQIDGIAEVIIAARERRRHTRPANRGPPYPDADMHRAGRPPSQRGVGQPP